MIAQSEMSADDEFLIRRKSGGAGRFPLSK